MRPQLLRSNQGKMTSSSQTQSLMQTFDETNGVTGLEGAGLSVQIRISKLQVDEQEKRTDVIVRDGLAVAWKIKNLDVQRSRCVRCLHTDCRWHVGT